MPFDYTKKYTHVWQCKYCGYTIRRVSSKENMPTPLPPNGCKANPSGKKFAPHVMIKAS